MPEITFDDESALVQVMGWYLQPLNEAMLIQIHVGIWRYLETLI